MGPLGSLWSSDSYRILSNYRVRSLSFRRLRGCGAGVLYQPGCGDARKGRRILVKGNLERSPPDSTNRT